MRERARAAHLRITSSVVASLPFVNATLTTTEVRFVRWKWKERLGMPSSISGPEYYVGSFGH